MNDSTDRSFSLLPLCIPSSHMFSFTPSRHPCTVVRSNHTHITATVGPGVGQNLPVIVKVGNLSSPPATALFNYDAPVMGNVSVFDQGGCAGSEGETSLAESGDELHGCTRGGTILLLRGENFGPRCLTTSSRASDATRACSCAVRLGAPIHCGDSDRPDGATTVANAVNAKKDASAVGSWCRPLTWTHDEIRCTVGPGAGALLAVGLVTGGTHFTAGPAGGIASTGKLSTRRRRDRQRRRRMEEGTVSTPSLAGVPRFSYDPPMIDAVTPNVVAVDGGEAVSIYGDNFGPIGTMVRAQYNVDGAVKNEREQM